MTDQGLGRIESYGLGRFPSTKDVNDWNLRQLYRRVDTGVTEKLWEFNKEALDQKESPHCGGFSMAHYGIVMPTFSDYTNEDGHAFYKLCELYDGTTGMDMGTSIRTIANVGRNIRMWANYAFATDTETIYDWVLNFGPLIMGTEWYNDMFLPDENHVIHCTGAVAGGHAWVLIGANRNTGFIDGLTSWGPTFGDNGRFKISMTEFNYLFAQQGEAIAAVEVGKVDPSVVQSGCRNTPIGKALQRIWG